MPNKKRYEKLLAIRDFLEQTIYPKLKSRFGVSLFAEPKKETWLRWWRLLFHQPQGVRLNLMPPLGTALEILQLSKIQGLVSSLNNRVVGTLPFMAFYDLYQLSQKEFLQVWVAMCAFLFRGWLLWFLCSISGKKNINLGGGNSNIFSIFTPNLGEMIQSNLTCAYFPKRGWFKQPPKEPLSFVFL